MLCHRRTRRVHRTWRRSLSTLSHILWYRWVTFKAIEALFSRLKLFNRYSKCSALWKLRSRVQTQPNFAESRTQHFWGAEQPRVFSYQNNEGSQGSFEMWTMCRVFSRFGMLWSGNHWASFFSLSSFNLFSVRFNFILLQSHLERMVKSMVDYDESNKADNDSKKVNK